MCGREEKPTARALEADVVTLSRLTGFGSECAARKAQCDSEEQALTQFMSRIFDNIQQEMLMALRATLQVSRCADFRIGQR